MPEAIYTALNGEEVRRAILAELKQTLEQDQRFKRALAYHRVSWKCAVELRGYALPPHKVTVEGEVEAKTLQQEFDQFKTESRAGLDLLKDQHASEIRQLNHAKAELQTQVDTLRDFTQNLSLQKAAEAVGPITPEIPVGTGAKEGEEAGEVITISMERDAVEEPGRIREEIQTIVPAEEQMVGRAPSEVSTRGADVKMPREGRGAVVGGGKRPSSVIGRPGG